MCTHNITVWMTVFNSRRLHCVGVSTSSILRGAVKVLSEIAGVTDDFIRKQNQKKDLYIGVSVMGKWLLKHHLVHSTRYCICLFLLAGFFVCFFFVVLLVFFWLFDIAHFQKKNTHTQTHTFKKKNTKKNKI